MAFPRLATASRRTPERASADAEDAGAAPGRAVPFSMGCLFHGLPVPFPLRLFLQGLLIPGIRHRLPMRLINKDAKGRMA
jgi:hypothetical protein